MPEEISAWGDYEQTAQNARPLPNQRNLTRRSRRASVPVTLKEVDGLLRYSKYFDSEEHGPVESTPIDEEHLVELDLPDHIQEQVRKIFAVFFEGVHPPETFDMKARLSLLMGTMPWLQDSLRTSTQNHPPVIAMILLFVELSLRGIGQVFFQNSPLSGLIILIGLFVQSMRIALHGVLGLVVGNLTAYLLGFAPSMIESGLFGYNSVLVGLAMATFAGDWSLEVTIGVTVIAALSSIFFVMMGKLLVPYQSPPLTFPFNLATLLILVSTAASDRWSIQVRDPAFPDYAANSGLTLSSGDFWAGTIRGVGQVFLADSTVSGCLILLGIAVCSPIAAVASYMGSLLGCLWAWGAGSPAGISDGLWGYNPSLCAAAMFMFYVPSFGSGIFAALSVVTVVLAQQALVALFAPFGLPVMTLPFCVIALPFIIIQGTTSAVISVPLPSLTIPEDHLRRVRMLQNGFQNLKDALSGNSREDGFLRSSGKLTKALSSISSQVGDADDISVNKEMRMERIAESEKWVHEEAIAIYKHMGGEIKLYQFLSALKGSGLSEDSGIQFAGHVFRLMDLDGSGTIDKKEFIALALVSQALLEIHRDLAKFFDLVDADQSESISFEELDEAGVYLGKTPLSQDERQTLSALEEAKAEDGELDVLELVNFVTVTHVKVLVATYHEKTTKSL